MKKRVAVYSILMGVLQTGTWIVLTISGSVANDIAAKPVETVVLILVELLTAGAVIAGGTGILSGQKWGVPLDLAALGMLLYCVIFSIGVFGQAGVAPAAAFFALLSVLTAVSIALLLGPSFRRWAAP